jgi:hypothetical protein
MRQDAGGCYRRRPLTYNANTDTVRTRRFLKMLDIA